ncbi:MAG TPA: hypothetical protein VGR01_01720 [Burkholderiales bacterium]|jgi:hypothetical protein|nr:hypothetical protein [Burkholderiales bacterium]
MQKLRTLDRLCVSSRAQAGAMAVLAAAYGTMTVEFDKCQPGRATRASLQSDRVDSIWSIYVMSDHEILLRWLATAAARMGWNRRMRELGRYACALVALCLLAEVLETFGVPAPVLSAAAPLFVIAALAIVALLTWRLAYPTTLAQAAGAADTRAGLKDELKSAHWFAQRTARDAFVELLLTRAARTAQTLDARRLFPLAVPRSALAALSLAILTGALTWFSPRIALPVTQEPMSGPASPGAGRTLATAVGENEIDKIAAQSASPNAAKKDDLTAAWSRLERLTKELPAGAEQGPIMRAVAARDARLTAQLLQASERNRAAVTPQDPAARPSRELKSADTAQRLLEALQGILNNEANTPPEPPTKAEVTPTIRTATRLREQAREERRKITGTPAQGEVRLNSRLRARSRTGVGMREVAYGEGEAAEGGSRTSVSGAASGDRTGRSQAGGSEGEHPNNSPTGAGDDEPVLGERTERLVAQLEKMSGERNENSKRQETEEEFYSATQRQASQVEYESITALWRAQREAVVPPDGTPLSYREAVKQYFLRRHAKDE